MKTLVLFGSAQEKGKTRDLLNIFISNIKGEVDVIDCYRTKVYPCVDCKICHLAPFCSINDEMTAIYEKVEEAKNIVIFAPVYFNSVPAPMKIIFDRFQVNWAARLRGDRDKELTKRGAMVFLGGAPAHENQFLGCELVVKGVFEELRVKNLDIVTISGADKHFDATEEALVERIVSVAKLFKCGGGYLSGYDTF